MGGVVGRVRAGDGDWSAAATSLRELLRVPEVLAVPVPFQCLRPLADSAVHAVSRRVGFAHIRVIAEQVDDAVRINVHDDGFGVDRHKLADARTALRGAYGDDFGMVVQAEPGNTKVTVRVPR